MHDTMNEKPKMPRSQLKLIYPAAHDKERAIVNIFVHILMREWDLQYGH